MRKSNITNKNLKELISKLKEKSDESKLLLSVVDDFEKPSRIRREVNLTRINRFTKEDEVIVVPGKVLGGGELDHKITISALKFSGSALSKIEKSGSKIVPIENLIKEPVSGKKIRIIG